MSARSEFTTSALFFFFSMLIIRQKQQLIIMQIKRKTLRLVLNKGSMYLRMVSMLGTEISISTEGSQVQN